MRKAKLTLSQILLAVVVVALMVGLVINNLTLHKVSADLDKANKEYNTLVAQGETLKQQINEKVNFTNIDELATERLGMVKVESFQIHYVDISHADTMSAAQTPDNGLVDNIVRSFNIMVEYLR